MPCAARWPSSPSGWTSPSGYWPSLGPTKAPTTPPFLPDMGSPTRVAGRLPPRRAELRAMLRLASPVVIIQLGMMSMGVVDTVMVGHLSTRALAAVALGNLYFFCFAVFGMGTLMVLDPIVAQAVGARD